MMSFVRVLMLVENNSYPKDPRVRKEAEALAAAGYRVCVISPADQRQRWHERVSGVDVYRFPAPPAANGMVGYLYEYGYSMMGMFLLSLWVFLRVGFDVIHAANPPDTLVFIAAFYKCLGKRFVFDHHDLAPEMYYARFPKSRNRLVYWALVTCEKLSCRFADQVIAVNTSYKSIEMSRGKVPESRIAVVRNGPVLKSRTPVKSTCVPKQKGKITVVYAGIIGVQDGVDILLRVISRLVFELGRTEVSCLIVGDGDAMHDLKQLVQELRLEAYVQFTGWISDAATYMQYISSADICVDPSPSNAYNDCCTAIKMMEYMAAAKPIVAFDLREHRFTAGPSALYARPNDEGAFATAIAELMDDEPRRGAMGEAGHRRVEQELAWQYSVPVLLAVYSRLFPRSYQQVLSVAE